MADTNEEELQDTLDTTEEVVKEKPSHKEAVSEPETPKGESVAPEVVTPASTVSDPAPAAVAPSTPVATPHANTPGVVVLQWLTYAFWGWLILGLIWLISVILINAILKESVSEVVPYAVAVSIILLPIAFVTDLLYRKHEPVKKTGAAMVIMVIHAVIFALLGIAALITAAFVGLNAAINAGDNIDAQIVGLITALAAAVLYVAAFGRTLNPFKSKKPAMMYGISMLVVSVMLLIVAIVGPVIQSVIGRNDKLIEQNISSVQRGVNSYITANKALPGSLNDISITDKGGKELIEKDLVELVPGTTQSTTTRSGLRTTVTYRYELCVTYATASNSNNGYYDDTVESDDYKSYLYVYSHKAGRECYKLKGTTYEYTSGSSSGSSDDDLQN